MPQSDMSAPASVDEGAGNVMAWRLEGGEGEPTLHVRRQPAPGGPPVIYVHGATFPSALSVFYRFDGRAWADDLVARGFDVWAFDFAGYGGSDRIWSPSSGAAATSGCANDAVRQLHRVAAFVRRITGRPRLSLIAHSWGSIVAGRFAGEHAGWVRRLVLFGPIAQRVRRPAAPSAPPTEWRRITVADQLKRFTEDVPAGHPPVLLEPDLATWGPAYIASDPGAAARQPSPAVLTPPGPVADIAAAHGGALPYDPGAVRTPTLIVRGAWDSLCTDADAAWLMARLGTREARDVKIPAATHLMHLETGREGLFEATGAFLGL